MLPVYLYDTTLRDGTQGENISFSAMEKLKIAVRLDEFGIHYIEGGWPGSNPRDMQFFELVKKHPLSRGKITAFGSTRKPYVEVSKDENIGCIIEVQTPAVAIFGKSWDLHVTEIMGCSLDENLKMIEESVAYLKDRGKEVIYDAEHFFDGFAANPEYAVATIKAAAKAGADFLVLCDTNGGRLFTEIGSAIREIRSDALLGSVPLGIHAHNDCGLAVANSICAVENGAVMVQGTINGYGERCGNADLTSVIPLLCLKLGRKCIEEDNLKKLKNLSRFVSETANAVPLNSRPFVGKSAFAHKGGVHVNAIRKRTCAYEHIDPELVGNKRRVLMSDLSGKSNVEVKAEEFDLRLGGNGYDSKKIVEKIKRMEQDGYQFDVADGSFKILLEKLTQQFEPAFDLESFRVVIEKNRELPCQAHATIKISVGDTEEITAAEGHGPVSALDNALRKALGRFYPDLDTMRLVDFKVRVIDGRTGTAAKVRVLIESRDQDGIWSTIGVSEDIIEASWQALADSFHFKLEREKEFKKEPV